MRCHKAEAGDAQAQVSLAGSLASNFRCADALQWYRNAANLGNADAAYRSHFQNPAPSAALLQPLQASWLASLPFVKNPSTSVSIRGQDSL